MIPRLSGSHRSVKQTPKPSAGSMIANRRRCVFHLGQIRQKLATDALVAKVPLFQPEVNA